MTKATLERKSSASPAWCKPAMRPNEGRVSEAICLEGFRTFCAVLLVFAVLDTALSVVLAVVLPEFCAAKAGFLEATGFRAVSLSAACDESVIKAKKHKGKHGLNTRQDNKRLSEFKAILSLAKDIVNLATGIITH